MKSKIIYYLGRIFGKKFRLYYLNKTGKWHWGMWSLIKEYNNEV